jgi:hypothetical protein
MAFARAWALRRFKFSLSAAARRSLLWFANFAIFSLR